MSALNSSQQRTQKPGQNIIKERRNSSTSDRRSKLHDAVIDICDTKPPVKKKPQAKCKEECPCTKSLGEYWLILCSNSQCKQRWHTHCSNLPGPRSEDEVNSLTEHGWLCPWCYGTNYKRPASHPVSKQEASLLTAGMVSQICETVRSTCETSLIPELNTRSDPKDISKDLNDFYIAIRGELNSLKEEIEKFSTIKDSLESNGNLDGHLHSEPTIPDVLSEDPPYISLSENIMDEALVDELTTYVNSAGESFKEIGKNRKTLYFGEYCYKYGDTKHQSAPFPEAIQKLLDFIKDKYPNENYNSCLISQYNTGSDFCPSHKDDEPWIDPKSNICTISLGSNRVMRFSRSQSPNESEPEPLDLELQNNSLLMFSRKSQEEWKHSIIPDKNIQTKRWSFTLRCIKPYFMNSTLVIGDSNTKELKFGDGKGCFGAWVPGERIQASRIADIPDPSNLYPYRNLLLHVGINDINRHNREPTKTLISSLDTKCKTISQRFPNMRIFISLLLPTTNPDLNCSVNELNQQLQALVNSRSYLYNTIQHHNLLDQNRMLRANFCRDYIHLNGLGLSEFVRTIKTAVIHKRPESNSTNGAQSSGFQSLLPKREPKNPPPWGPPAPYSSPVPPLPGQGWPPTGMRSMPHWFHPVHTPPCPPPWFQTPYLRPSTSGFNSLSAGPNTYRVGMKYHHSGS